MKILSLNIKGVGGANKRNYVRDLISREQVDMVCLQETKCSDFSREKVCLLWGTNEVDWVENKVVNNAGGVITMWSNRAFQLSSFVNGRNFSVRRGVEEGHWNSRYYCEYLLFRLFAGEERDVERD